MAGKIRRIVYVRDYNKQLVEPVDHSGDWINCTPGQTWYKGKLRDCIEPSWKFYKKAWDSGSLSKLQSPWKSQNGTKVPLVVNLIAIVVIAERDEEAQVNTRWDHAFSYKIQQWCSVLFEFLFRKISFLKPWVGKDKNCETSGNVRVN